ncbi:MAG: hypothetical protein ACREIP_12010 [Alphaproteobacteria bacterium]
MHREKHSSALQGGAAVRNYTIDFVSDRCRLGITYKAREDLTTREVAIREYFPAALVERDRDGATVRPSDSASEDFALGLASFRKEARLLSCFYDPRIVRVLAYFELNNTGYLVIAFQRGAPDTPRRGPSRSDTSTAAVVVPWFDGVAHTFRPALNPGRPTIPCARPAASDMVGFRSAPAAESTTVAYGPRADANVAVLHTAALTLIPDLDQRLVAAGPVTTRLSEPRSFSRARRAFAGAFAFSVLAGMFYVGADRGWLSFVPESAKSDVLATLDRDRGQADRAQPPSARAWTDEAALPDRRGGPASDADSRLFETRLGDRVREAGTPSTEADAVAPPRADDRSAGPRNSYRPPPVKQTNTLRHDLRNRSGGPRRLTSHDDGRDYWRSPGYVAR